MNHEVMMYAIAQKEQLGFDKAVEECSAPMPATTIIVFLLTFASLCTAEYRMSRYGVTPNVNQTPTRTYALPIRTPFDACACARADDDHAAPDAALVSLAPLPLNSPPHAHAPPRLRDAAWRWRRSKS